MTALRPDESPSYEDTGQFVAAVGQLADPLSDPLPGRRPIRPAPEARPESAQAAVPEPEADVSPWFRPHEMPQQEPQQEQRASQQSQQQAPQQTPQYDAGYTEPVTWPISDVPRQAPATGTVTEPEPEPRPAPPRVRRRGVPGETEQFPAVRPDGTPDETGGGGEAEETTPNATPTAPAPGGRAERRKAARQGAGHRARGRTASAPSEAPEPAQAAQKPPMTRLEARRAERAAKDSPAVILSRVIGEVFISVGVLMLLFVTYQLWWTNIRAHQQASGATSALQNQWSNDKGADRKADAFSPGQGFAIMYIPKLDVKAPIAEGVSKHSVLDKGMIGHYTGALKTAMPWDKQGNFALAAHRNTHGEPFRYINKLVPGDKIVVETESTYYTYEMTSVLPSTSPSNVTVIQPVPKGSGFTKPGRYITLTTCTPEFTSTYRMIVWGKMVEERPRSQGKPAALPD